MKKTVRNSILFDRDIALNDNLTINKNKTTNINILLNRVRLDKKRNLKKKIIFLSILVSIVGALVIFAII